MSQRPKSKLDLSQKKRALLQALLEREGAGSAERIPPRDSGPVAPLSFAQERVWFLDQMAHGTPLFNVPGAVPLRGPLDVDTLRRALQEVAHRHETLRTTLDAGDGAPVQRVHAPAEIALDVVSIDAADAEAVRDWLRAEMRRPFDVVGGPLWRAVLLRTGEQEHVLSVCMHHSISEAAALGVLFDEVAALYAAFKAGQPSPLPALPIQYGDYAAWQRQWVRDRVVGAQLDYWKEQLGGTLPQLQLPLDRPRPASPTYTGAFAHRRLSSSLTDPLADFAKDAGATPFMLYLAAFAALLSRYGEQDDVLIGSPIARRDRAELEGLIGFFVNTIVLRTDLGGGPSFRELLARVRGVALDAFSHADLPFELVVEALQPGRAQGATSLFQVMFDLPAEPRPALALADLEPARVFEPWDVHSGTTKVDLALFLWNVEDGMVAAVEYNTDLFDRATIERFLTHYENLLAAALAAPDTPLAELEILAPAERRQLLVEWNRTAVEFDRGVSVQQLVEAQVARTPDALALSGPALDGGASTLTYSEWNRRANQLAHRLIEHGVGPDVLVAVCMERTPALVVALLAVLKAGGAYVPLDPGNPAERQAMMLEDAGVPVLLTQSSVLPGLPDCRARVIAVDRDAAEIEGAADHDPACRTNADHLSYVIFTSGSTGRPKGVQIPHRGLVNLLSWHRRVYEVTAADRATQLAGTAFDASVWELWPYLTAGASIHLPDEETRAGPRDLLHWLAAEKITLTFLPTPLAELVIAEPQPPDMALRCMLTGGDKLHRPPPPGLTYQLVNHYGPSESSVVTTCVPIDAAERAGSAPPIGRPIDNTRVYLLDRHLQPVPIGVPGELMVAGDGLARGYHGRPDLTEERFLPDPFAADRAARMYRTGDLARYRADGQIEFLGRIDHQVKVRGFRIELGEIEAVLAAHDAVRDALVVVREDRPGEKRLVAYLRPAPETAPPAAALRAFAADRLPEYMVPAAFVCLDAFPLTRNGKVDRDALPPPAEPVAGESAPVAPPGNELEQRLAGIWAELLGTARVGIDDNFFELGGHSLLMVQVRNRLEAELGRTVSMVQLFKHPTVRALAAALSDAPVQPVTADAGVAAGRREARREARRDALRGRRDRRARRSDG